MGSRGVGQRVGEDGEGVGRGDFLPLSVEYGLQDAPCSQSSDSHFCFAVGDEVWLWGWVVLGASPQGVAGARIGGAKLALVTVSLPPEGMLVGVPALEVGGGVVGQGMWGHLVGAGLLSILLGRAVLGAEGPWFIVYSYGVQREVPLGSQLGQVPSLGGEVIIDLVGCPRWTEKGRGEQREGERERRERDS